MSTKYNSDFLVAIPKKTIRRLYGKILMFIARKTPLLPSRIRGFLQLSRGVKFSEFTSVFIGQNVYFDDLYPELISVGRKVIIAEGAIILTHFVEGKSPRTKAAPYQFYQGRVEIGDYVFIGVNVVISKPVKIGNGAMIGANAVVTRDVPENAVMVGVPARQVGTLPSVE